jgi:hypothetical protein
MQSWKRVAPNSIDGKVRVCQLVAYILDLIVDDNKCAKTRCINKLACCTSTCTIKHCHRRTPYYLRLFPHLIFRSQQHASVTHLKYQRLFEAKIGRDSRYSRNIIRLSISWIEELAHSVLSHRVPSGKRYQQPHPQPHTPPHVPRKVAGI